MFFLLLVYDFNFDLFEFLAAILEKCLLGNLLEMKDKRVRVIRLKADDDSDFSILGDPGAVSRDDAKFSGESLLLDVSLCPKILRPPKI